MRVNKTKTSIAIAFCLFLVLVSALIINAGQNNLSKSYVYSIDSYGIHKLDTRTDSKKVIFNTAGMYKVSFSISPSDTVIAVLITERGVVPPGEHDYSVLPKNLMVFIDPEGNEITTLDEDVRKFSWSPDGEKIAYVTGTYDEDKGFMSTGLYLFDLTDGSKRQIAPRAYYVNWAVFDSCIYYEGFKYDPTTGKTEKTSYHGINFSPDGKYYIALSSMEYPRLYISASNEEITDQVKLKLGYVPRSWMPQEKHHLHAVKIDYEPRSEDTVTSGRPLAMIKVERKVIQKTFFIYDVETDQIIKEWMK